MTYELSEIDAKIIESSLQAYLKQCKEFIKLDDKVKTFTGSERANIEEKIKRINVLLESM